MLKEYFMIELNDKGELISLPLILKGSISFHFIS